MMKRKFGWIMILLVMLSAGSMAWAGDHERARALLKQGKILSLSEIMKQANSRVPGKILEVELEEKGGKIVYEIEFLSEHGVVMEMLIDARTGRLISVKED
jgi:uncharacterized membrane protein YkoI